MEPKLCECGCDGVAPIAAKGNARLGIVKGQPTRFIAGHNLQPSTAIDDRFWSKVAMGSDIACWLWQGKIRSDGYGNFSVNGRTLFAHRVAYELKIGPVPSGLTIDHLCRNRACVNPTHLEAVTLRLNILRGNTLPAQHASKTHCPQGHPYDASNTDIRYGRRYCRECHRNRRQKKGIGGE